MGGVLSILNYVEHGESLLVFREPFIMDMHTHLRYVLVLEPHRLPTGVDVSLP